MGSGENAVSGAGGWGFGEGVSRVGRGDGQANSAVSEVRVCRLSPQISLFRHPSVPSSRGASYSAPRSARGLFTVSNHLQRQPKPRNLCTLAVPDQPHVTHIGTLPRFAVFSARWGLPDDGVSGLTGRACGPAGKVS